MTSRFSSCIRRHILSAFCVATLIPVMTACAAKPAPTASETGAAVTVPAPTSAAITDIAGSAAAAMPRPEHPNPQAVRAEWLNLNGTWEYAESESATPEHFLTSTPYPEKIVVPFCRESPLSGIHRRDFVKNLWYRRSFEVPKDWKSPRVWFHVGACDWRTRLWINGTFIGTHTGGNVPVSFDVTAALKTGVNTVVIGAFDDTPGGLQALGKQSNRPGESFGIFYTPTTGVWQTVWIEGVGASSIRHFRVDGDPNTGAVAIQSALDGSFENLTLRAEVRAGGDTIATAEVPAHNRDVRLSLTLPNPRAWSHTDPYLYDLRLTLVRNGKPVDTVDSYFGLRTVSIVGRAILVNGAPVFQRLILDQGFYPDGVWTAPSDAALRGDIELSMACGFNGARLHQKVFEPRFLYWADKLGYLVWGEFPSYGANYTDPRVNLPIIDEWREIVARDRNHPSIIGWCPFNETPGDAGPLQEVVHRLTRDLDPSRPAIETSGWTHTMSNPMVLDEHDYNQDGDSLLARWGSSSITVPSRYGIAPKAEVPFMISECGGIGYDVDKGWGYGKAPETIEAFHERFDGVVNALLNCRNLFGFCYTQLTDVEQEHNGLYYYDRRPKFDVNRIAAVVKGKVAYEEDPPLTTASREEVLDWALLIGAYHDDHLCWSWRYTTEKPAKNWNKNEFDESKWGSGRPPYGKKEGGFEEMIRTPWDTSDIWLRQGLAYDGKPFEKAALVISYDNATQIYLNGELIWKRNSWSDRYDAYDVTDAVRKHIVPGMNLLAAHVHQDGGGQYFDAALLLGAKPRE